MARSRFSDRSDIGETSLTPVWRERCPQSTVQPPGPHGRPRSPARSRLGLAGAPGKQWGRITRPAREELA
eukprot:7516579-Alexandrium_andersonii.AAC.1